MTGTVYRPNRTAFWAILGTGIAVILVVVAVSSASGATPKGKAVRTAATRSRKLPAGRKNDNRSPATTAHKGISTTAPPTTAHKSSSTAAPPTTAKPKPTTTTVPPTTVPARTVEGKLTTLGAGNFTGGTDVEAGLYNVTTIPGEFGNFVVQDNAAIDPLVVNEILGAVGDDGVPEIRVRIVSGDQIQISGLSEVIFTPVTTPYVTMHSTVNLYAGTWTVGQDIGPGRYVATAPAGQSGNFSVTDPSAFDPLVINEILGDDTADGDVPNITMTLTKGETIDVSGLAQVTMTAQP